MSLSSSAVDRQTYMCHIIRSNLDKQNVFTASSMASRRSDMGSLSWTAAQQLQCTSQCYMMPQPQMHTIHTHASALCTKARFGVARPCRRCAARDRRSACLRRPPPGPCGTPRRQSAPQSPPAAAGRPPAQQQVRGRVIRKQNRVRARAVWMGQFQSRGRHTLSPRGLEVCFEPVKCTYFSG